MKEKVLCKVCGYEFEANETELEYNELDPSGRQWNEKKDEVCNNCKEDLEDDL